MTMQKIDPDMIRIRPQAVIQMIREWMQTKRA